MPRKTAYELAARQLGTQAGCEPSDDFWQNAAANRELFGQVGTTEPTGDVNEKTRHSGG